MRQFDEIDPFTIEQHPDLIAKLPDDRNSNKTWYLLVIDDYIVIANATYKERKQKWLHYQIEFPKEGLQWFLDTMQNKFFKTEAEGGLPKGKFHDKTTVKGERIKLGRAFNADGNRGGGFYFATLDRRDIGLAKEYTFTDQLLFKHGMLQMFQDVAAKIASGLL